MLIFAAGVNHRTAPVDVRECLHLAPEEIVRFLETEGKRYFREAAIVSTCNRTELYAIPQDPHMDASLLTGMLRNLRPDQEFLPEHFFQLFTCGAVSHLYKVAAAVDSQVLGDVQILGQVKEAFDLAVQAGTTGSVFHHLFTGGLHAGKRVRHETSIGLGAVSISFAAVELATKIFADLHRKSVLIVGTGESSALAARHLLAKGVERIWVTNRTFENALPLAKEIKAEVIPFDEFPSRIAEFDIIVSATSATEPVITYDMVKPAMKKRQSRPLLILDIAVPRDVDARVNDIPNVFLKDLDSIQGIVDRNLEARRNEVPRAEAIVTEEVVNFFLWYNSLEATPTIQDLRQKFEDIRTAEMEKFRNKIDGESFEAVEILTKRIVNKLLHPTMVGMRKPAQNSDELSSRIQLVRDLFDLGENGIDTTNEMEQE